MKKLLVTLALLTASATFAAKDTDPFFGPITPNNTVKTAIKQAVKEANAYTDKKVSDATGGAVTTNDLNEVKTDVAQVRSDAAAAGNLAAEAKAATDSLAEVVEGKIDAETAAATYQPKGNYLTEHQDISGKLDVSVAAETYQPKGDYLTEHQDISGKLDRSEIIKNGVFDVQNVNNNGSTSRLWNEADGGGALMIDGRTGIKSYVGVNEGSDGSSIYAQIYAVNKDNKVGTRINVNDKGAYYTRGKSTYTFSTNDEIAVLGDFAKYLTIVGAAELYQPKGNYLTAETDPTIAAWAKAEFKPTYDATEITYVNGYVSDYLAELNSKKANKTDLPVIPTNVTAFVNDAGYLTSHQDISGKLDVAAAAATYQPKGDYLTAETDPSVPAWAKEESKPTYNATEILFGNGFLADYLTELNAAKANKSDLFRNGVFHTELVKGNGSKALIFNESDGGGIQFDDAASGIIAAVAVNEGSSANDLYAQIYAKNKATGVGTRLNVTQYGAFLTTNRNTYAFTENDRVVVFNDLGGYLSTGAAADLLDAKADKTAVTALGDDVASVEGALATKAEKEDVYTKTQADEKFLTSHQSLDAYLKKADAYNKTEIDETVATLEVSIASKASKSYAYSKEESDAKYLTTHQDISGKLDVTTAAATYQPKGEYLTEHQDISGKANIGDSYTKEESDAKYLTEHQSLAGYATETWVTGRGYLTEHQDISGKLDATVAANTYQPKGNYLTEHQDISGKIDRSELFANGVFETINTKLNGTKARLWNESDGGGAMIDDGTSNVRAFTGVNEGGADGSGLYAQIYAKNKSSNVGTRLNVHTNKIYYTKNKTNGNVVDDDELAVKGDLKNFITEHQDISGKLDASVAASTYQLKGEYLTAGDIAGKLDTAVAEATYQPKGEYLTATDIAGKLDKSEVFKNGYFETNFKNSRGSTAKIWNESDGGGTMFDDVTSNVKSFVGVNEGSLDGGLYVQIYAKNKTSNVGTRLNVHTNKIYYTKNKANGSVTDDDELVVKGDIKDFITEHQDLSGIMESINKLTKRLSLLEAAVALIENKSDMVEVDGTVSYNSPSNDVALSGSISAPTGASVTARKVSVSGLNGTMTPASNGNALTVNAESVNMMNSELAGTTQQSSNLIKVMGADTMTIKGVTFTGDTYNTVMTGQNTTEFLKELNVEDCTFDENCKHINIWFAAFQDNAVLNIKNCTFKTCEQFLCISDFQGAVANHLTVNIENVTIENYETGDAYEGIILCDDRVCTSAEQFRSVNPFSNVVFNFKNVTAKGVKLTAATFGVGTGTAGQMMYLYSAKGGGVYKMNEDNAALFPTFNFVD